MIVNGGPRAKRAQAQAEELRSRGFTVWLSDVYLERLDNYRVDDWDFADQWGTCLLHIEAEGIRIAAYSEGHRHLQLLKQDKLATALGADSNWERSRAWYDELIPEATLQLFKHYGEGTPFEFDDHLYKFKVFENGWFENICAIRVVSEPYYEPPFPHELETAWEYEREARLQPEEETPSRLLE